MMDDSTRIAYEAGFAEARRAAIILIQQIANTEVPIPCIDLGEYRRSLYKAARQLDNLAPP
jgi:hypothetical protein